MQKEEAPINCESLDSDQTAKSSIRPLISVVLATKGNKLMLLERCIKSLQKQTFKEFEIILVYSIFPQELCELLKSCNIFALKENGSTLGSARNLGVKNAKAEIIAFIDDDAEAPEDWLTKIYLTFQKYPSLFCLGGPNLTPPEESEKKPLSFVIGSFMESRMGHNVILDRSAVGKIAGCNVAYRKTAFDNIGYLNEKLKTAEDWEFHIRLAEKGYSLRFDPDILVWHHRQGITHGFKGSSNSVPFFLSRKTLRYARYESFIASFYLSNLSFLILLVVLFLSPFVFLFLLFFFLLGHFIFTAVRTKIYDRRVLYYPLQILSTLMQISGFYYGILKRIVSYLSR
jgi:GT2 family glycosyltransferase